MLFSLTITPIAHLPIDNVMKNKLIILAISLAFMGVGYFYLFKNSRFINWSIENGDNSILGKSTLWSALRGIITSNSYGSSFKFGGLLLIIAGFSMILLLVFGFFDT